MKITDKEYMSEWAYYQCRKGNDTPEMRNLIIDDYWRCQYCIYIEYRNDIASKIKNKKLLTIMEILKDINEKSKGDITFEINR